MCTQPGACSATSCKANPKVFIKTMCLGQSSTGQGLIQFHTFTLPLLQSEI